MQSQRFYPNLLYEKIGITIRKSEERGHADHGWLNTYHTFSFADYHDPAWMGFQSLRVINDDTVAGGGGFGMHPHRDMEIITYILRGALQHRDSMGHSEVLRPGEVQRISAGSGIPHSETNPSADEPVHLLQIWIKPDQKNLKPDYQQKSFQTELNSGKFVLVASKKPSDGAIQINQDVDLFIAHVQPKKPSSTS